MKKRSKILAAAIALLGFSTAASITGTVAWFTASNIVSVSGMSITADVEQGIVISNEDSPKVWGTSTTATHNSTVAVIPTSTLDASSWYHENAVLADNYAADEMHDAITITTTDGVGKATVNNVERNLYLLNHFYIQSSANSALANQDIYVKKVNPVSTAKDLNKSLRVLVEVSGNTDSLKTFIYAPVTGYDASYSVHGATAFVPQAAGDNKIDVLYTGNIVAYTAEGTGAIDIAVYCYFEGEDENCKSTNITADLGDLAVGLEFGNRPHSA